MYKIKVVQQRRGDDEIILEYAASVHPQAGEILSCFAGTFIVSTVEHALGFQTDSRGLYHNLKCVILTVVGR